MKNTIVTPRLRIFLSILALGLSSPLIAQEADTNKAKEEPKPLSDFWNYQELDEDLHADPVSESFEYVLNRSHQFANWVDHFFDDDRTRGIKNTTRIKLGYWVTHD
ncbi:MAG: hypothetical protein KAJ95_01555, partial [Gammaproteobacteria bacterium]|nr:hypothetical protein [Gammaproteobacteria bacterium]